MGLFDDDDDEFLKELEALKRYPACVTELKEGIVNEIFNRCIASGKSKDTVLATLFPRVLGYEKGTEKSIYFDKNILLRNEKKIEYLFRSIT